jgi:hypothetical protein
MLTKYFSQSITFHLEFTLASMAMNIGNKESKEKIGSCLRARNVKINTLSKILSISLNLSMAATDIVSQRL